MAPKNKLCCLIHTAPYHSSRTAEALDFILAASTMTEQLSVIFINNGIWQLLQRQQPDHIKLKAYTRGFAALPEFGIDNIYLDDSALVQSQLKLDDLFIQPTVLTTAAIQHHLTQQDYIFHF